MTLPAVSYAPHFRRPAPTLPVRFGLNQVAGPIPSVVMPPAALDITSFSYGNDWHEHNRNYARIQTAFDVFGQDALQRGMDEFRVMAGDWNIGDELKDAVLNIEILKRLGINITAPGNHEFDLGTEKLAQSLGFSNFYTLASNIQVPQTSPLYRRVLEQKLVREPIVFTGRHGGRYGVIGLALPNVTRMISPDLKMHGVDTLSFEDSAKVLGEQIQQLKAKGVNRIILVSHCGYKKDLQMALNNIPGVDTDGIDLILGGHSHTELNGMVPGVNLVRSKKGNPVLILQTGKDARALGRAIVGWTPQGQIVPMGNWLMNPAMFPENPAMTSLISQYKGPPNILGYIRSPFNTESAVNEGENPFASVIADEVRAMSGADIALFRGVEIRDQLHSGAFSDQDLQVLLPFNDKVAVFRMTGPDIQNALDESASCVAAHSAHPGVMHPSGLRYSINVQTGHAENIMAWDKAQRRYVPIDMTGNKVYTVATGEFISKPHDKPGQTEFDVFKSVPKRAVLPFKARDAFSRYVARYAQRGLPVEMPPKDGRIQVLGQGAFTAVMTPHFSQRVWG